MMNKDDKAGVIQVCIAGVIAIGMIVFYIVSMANTA